MRYRIPLTLSLFCLFSAAVFPVTVAAQSQSGGTICYSDYLINPDSDRVVTGTISNNDPVHEWTFEGEAGTFVHIRMEVTSGNLDPYLLVIDETTNQTMRELSANSGNGRIHLPNVSLGSDGMYTLRATRISQENGTSSGTYRLILEKSVTMPSDAASAPYGAQIYEGEIINGALPSADIPNIRHNWYFEGQSGDNVTVLLRFPSGAASWGSLEIRQLAEDSWNTITDASLTDDEIRISNFTLPEDGLYILNVDLNQDAQNYMVGRYDLTLNGAGGERPALPPCAAEAPTCPAEALMPNGENLAAIPLVNEEAASGNISGTTPIVPFSFTARAGDSVNLRMERSGGNLTPFLGLIDVDGNVLRFVDSFDGVSASLNNYALPVDGCYFVFTSRADVYNGTTEGTFFLTATGIIGSESETPIPANLRDMLYNGEIAPGDTATGALGEGDWRALYRIVGDGNPMTAQATRTSGDLLPSLTLYDGNGDEINSVSVSFTQDTSNPLVIANERGETYFLVVQRNGGQSGTSSGSFSLSLIR